MVYDTESPTIQTSQSSRVSIPIYSEWTQNAWLMIKWNVWLIATAFLLLTRLIFGIYHAARIAVNLWLFAATQLAKYLYRVIRKLKINLGHNYEDAYVNQLEEATSYRQWFETANVLDELDGKAEWRTNPKREPHNYAELTELLQQLKLANASKNETRIRLLLETCCNRSLCNLSSPSLFVVARSGTKHIISDLESAICEGIHLIAASLERDANLLEKHIKNLNASRKHHLSHFQASIETNLSPNLRKQPYETKIVATQKHSSNFSALASKSHSKMLAKKSKSIETQRHTEGLDKSLFKSEQFLQNYNCSAANGTLQGENGMDKILNSVPRLQTVRQAYDEFLKRQIQEEKVTLKGKLMEFCSEKLHHDASEVSNEGNDERERSEILTLYESFQSKCTYLLTMRSNIGQTALCLSGGGSLAMYHVGVVKELLENGCLPRVISGASGGSIVAAIIAMYDDEVLRKEILVPSISNKYGVKWFPPVLHQIRNFLNKGVMMDSEPFQNACKAYFKDVTFEDAFKKTGRYVSISCSPSQRDHNEALILSVMNAPNVLLWSAVAASCALPGLMAPVLLMAKNEAGEAVPAFTSEMKFVDGSLKSDLPQRDLAYRFGVKQFIVSQVNPHSAPFVSSYTCDNMLLRKFENFLILDIKSRYAELVRYNLLPRIFGENISRSWMIQEIEGHVTITPQASLFDWYRMICHPSHQDMIHFISSGQKRTWPQIPRIRSMQLVEIVLRDCFQQVEAAHSSVQKLINTI